MAMKSVKVTMAIPQKAIDDAIKERIKELERDNKYLKEKLKGIIDEAKSWT